MFRFHNYSLIGVNFETDGGIKEVITSFTYRALWHKY